MPGSQIGDYELLGRLGQGGMGETFLALHKYLQRKTVLKRIIGVIDEESLSRFIQEGQAAGSVNHRNVVNIYDMHHDDLWGLYIAMEYVEGLSLDKAMPNDLETALDIIDQITQALISIHTRGILHRDLKPANVFLTTEKLSPIELANRLDPAGPDRRLVVKVGDFGIARLPGGAAANLTSSGYLVGTPEYAAPEQFWDASTVDERADLYSLGVVLYQLLAGKLPPNYDRAFRLRVRGREDDFEEALLDIKTDEKPVIPSALRPDWPISPALDTAVLRLLQPDREKRYKTALEFFQDLTTLRQGLGATSPFEVATAASTHSPTSSKAKTAGTKLSAAATIEGAASQPGLFLYPMVAGRTLPKGRHLSTTDLMLARDPSRVRQLFAALGYQTYAGEIQVDTDMGFTEADAHNIKAAHWLADYDDFQVLLFELEDSGFPALRRLAQNLLRRGGNYLFIAVQPEIASDGQPYYPKLILVCPQRVSGSSAELTANPLIKLHRLVVDTTRPTRHALDVLEGLALLRPDLEASAVYKKVLSAFNIEVVTNRFYRRYYELYKKTVKWVRENNRGVAAFNEEAELRGFVQRLFGRLMFLYFVQKKGWLAGDSNFLTTQYRLSDGRREHFYNSLLLPLFFQTLARRDGEGRNTDPAAGPVWSEEDIPYLNGGLFEQGIGQDYEETLFLDNALFAPDVDGGILEFFNSYDFTVQEDTPLEVDVALDPEMLGKVFENLLEEDERGQSGTFYTPRAIVHFITRRALVSYLLDQLASANRAAGITHEKLMAQFDLGDGDDPAIPRLPVRAADVIEQALKNLRALDPAVGSGAFPVGLLQDMVSMRRAVARARGSAVRSGSAEIAGWKRDYILHCLYGVDIKPAAIEIAKLRLWLSLIVDTDRSQLYPLPNLDYKLMVGNSLLETINGQPVLPDNQTNQQLTLLDKSDDRERLLDEFERLREEWFEFEGQTSEKLRLRQQLLAKERELLLLSLAEQRQNLNDRQRNMLNLFNWETAQKTAKGKKELAEIDAGFTALDEVEKQVRQEGRRPFFLFRLHFSDVFHDRGGFDLVIGNPPYVRQEQIKEIKPQLTLAYPAVYAGTADLFVYFYERAWQLLRQGGHLAYITSNKFFRADYGANLRKFFAQKVRLETVIDFGDLPIFEATAYPAILIGAKGTPEPDQNVQTLTVQSMEAVAELEKFVAEHADNRTQTALSIEGWNLGEAAIQTLLAKIKVAGQPLRKDL